MARASILIMFLAMTRPFAQGTTYTIDVDLQLGKVDASEMILVKLEPIRTGVVFQRLPYPASCPSSRPGEFALKKTYTGSGIAIREPISNTCGFVDSVSIDTTLVYDVYTPRGEVYYMQMIELQGEKVKVRLTTAKPTAVQPKRSALKLPAERGDGFRADGRNETGPDEAHKSGIGTPIYRKVK